MAGALHPIGGRSGPDTVGLFTFLTLSDFQSFANDFGHRVVFAGQTSRKRRLRYGNAGSVLLLGLVSKRGAAGVFRFVRLRAAGFVQIFGAVNCSICFSSPRTRRANSGSRCIPAH